MYPLEEVLQKEKIRYKALWVGEGMSIDILSEYLPIEKLEKITEKSKKIMFGCITNVVPKGANKGGIEGRLEKLGVIYEVSYKDGQPYISFEREELSEDGGGYIHSKILSKIIKSKDIEGIDFTLDKGVNKCIIRKKGGLKMTDYQKALRFAEEQELEQLKKEIPNLEEWVEKDKIRMKELIEKHGKEQPKQ